MQNLVLLFKHILKAISSKILLIKSVAFKCKITIKKVARGGWVCQSNPSSPDNTFVPGLWHKNDS